MDLNAAMATSTAQMVNSIGQTATYTPVAGGASTITVIFDNDYQAVDLVSGAVASLGPAAHCKTADLTGTIIGGTLVIASVTYTITAVEPDGTGLSVVRLRK